MLFAPDVLSGEPHEIRSEDLEKHRRTIIQVEELLNELKRELQNAS